MGHILVHNTHSKDDVERASLAFLIGNTALSSGQEATVLLTVEGVWVAQKGYIDGLQAEAFSPLSDLVRQFLEDGGRLWACSACLKARKLAEADLIPGAQIVGAATVVDALLNNPQALSL